MHELKLSLLSLLMLSMPYQAMSQRNEILDDNIASLQVMNGTDWQSLLPIITLNSSDVVNISFDNFNQQYHRYTYKIEHCESDWSVSTQLFSSDYVTGFSEGIPIEDISQSVNTNVEYSHLSFSIPNEKCNIKLSGNYQVTVVDEDDNNRPILVAHFMVAEPLMNIGMSYRTNTDVDINSTHQQVDLSLSYNNVSVTNPDTQIKTIVMQNGRWDNARINARPDNIMPRGMQWTHCKDYIFDAGNEYRKFEILDVSHPTMGIETTDWDGKNYNAYIFRDEPRINYLYDEDANGAFCIRNSDNNDNDRLCQYVITHFTLKTAPTDNDIYIDGAFTNNSFLPKYKMTYNPSSGFYEASILLKQGYYSYKYLVVDNNGKAHDLQSEGNFFQTENAYQCLVYYRGNGERTDRLVGFSNLKQQ